MHRHALTFLLLPAMCWAQLGPSGATASFRGSLPPKPVTPLSAEQEAEIETRLASVTQQFQAVSKHERAADAHILLKAVRYALDFDEWHDKKPEDSLKKVKVLLDHAELRIAALQKNETPWMDGTGNKLLGFYSEMDGSPQPYGVEVPEDFDDRAKPAPMMVWLHGRSDTSTDLHFIYGRLKSEKPGSFPLKGTLVIHPFGRYCNGWKSAGEKDVFECRDDARRRWKIDENRIALAGFSMGGAGAWHIGAHFADQWACVHTGAGFADVKRYTKLTPENYPPSYEQTLWGVYDVPDYAANFKNVPLLSYSGEIDSQRDSAEYMTEVLAKEGIRRPHLIGPGVGHKYHPETQKEVHAWLEQQLAKGRDPAPRKVTLQFRSHRYAAMHWVEALECMQPFEDSRIEAEWMPSAGDEAARVLVKTKNIRCFHLDAKKLNPKARGLHGFEITIDGQKVETSPIHISTKLKEEVFTRVNGVWQVTALDTRPMKAGGTCMEDSLMRRFLMVLPEKKGSNAAVDAWVEAESQHFIQRWRSLMRGDPQVVTYEDIIANKSFSAASEVTLLLWGTPETNRLIADLLNKEAEHFLTSEKELPALWDSKRVGVGSQSFDASKHVLCAGYPRGLSTPRVDSVWEPWGSVLVNSGLTFREAHDKTNSLQNPKLPDWAILDITQMPSAAAAGRVVAADFFDARWEVPSAK
jgi:dienelactone hydrolase